MKKIPGSSPTLPYWRGKSWWIEVSAFFFTSVFYMEALIASQFYRAALWGLMLFWEYSCFRSEFQTWLFVRHRVGDDKHWSDGLNLPKRGG